MKKPECAGVKFDRKGPRFTAINGLFVLALFYTLYIISDLILPILLALLLSLLFNPIVSTLEDFHVPRGLGAALVVFFLVSGAAYLISSLADPASDWIKKAPEVFEEARSKLQSLLNTLREMDEAAEEAQMTSPSKNHDQLVFFEKGDIRNFLFGQTTNFLVSSALMFFLLFFFLESGDQFLRKLVKVLPNWTYKRIAVEAARKTQKDISKYLLTIAIINTVLGTIVGSVMYILEMPNPILWGAMAGLLNFVPYVGPTITLVTVAAVALLSFDDTQRALLVPLVYLTITSLEGQLITPHIIGGRLAMNPVVVFLGIIFFGWLWGFIGALMAVPILATLKIVFERFETRSVVAEMLGR